MPVMEQVTLAYPEWRLIEGRSESGESSDESNDDTEDEEGSGDDGATSDSSRGGYIPNQRLVLARSIVHYYEQELCKLALKFPNIQILTHVHQSRPDRNYFDTLPSRIYESVNY
jgi:hypothetical protein